MTEWGMRSAPLLSGYLTSSPLCPSSALPCAIDLSPSRPIPLRSPPRRPPPRIVQCPPRTWTASTWSSARWSRARSSSARSRATAPPPWAAPTARSRSWTAASSRKRGSGVRASRFVAGAPLFGARRAARRWPGESPERSERSRNP